MTKSPRRLSTAGNKTFNFVERGDPLRKSSPTKSFNSSELIESEDESKLGEYLNKLNDILVDYERQIVMQSAMVSQGTFNSLLKTFMTLGKEISQDFKSLA